MTVEHALERTARRPRPHRDQQRGALYALLKTDKETVAALESSNRYLAKCRDENPDKFVPWRPASRRRRRVPQGARALGEAGRCARRDHQLEPSGPLSGRGRGAAVLQARDRSRHPGVHASGRLHDAGDGRLSAGLEHRPAGRQLPVAGAADRARHLRAVSRRSSLSAAISAAASAR